MDAAVQLQASKALAQATQPNGTQAFVKSLQAQGVTQAATAELRYIGTAAEGYIDVTKRINEDVFGPVSVAPPPPPAGNKLSTSTMIGIIVGVVGGVCLLALIVALFVSHSRRGKRAEREKLSQQWKLERELGMYTTVS